MKQLKAISSLLFTALMSVLLSALFSVNPFATFGVLLALGFLLPKKVGDIAYMAIQKEIWTKDIVDNLFKNNEFAELAFNADQYVLDGKVVHIPMAGTPSTVRKNVTEFPVNAVKRTDSDILYAIDTYYSTPRHIERIEQYELSYDKRQSAMGEDQAALIQAAMDGLLYRWSRKGDGTADGLVPGTYKLTTGANTSVDLIDGATGIRKTFSKATVGEIKKAFDAANINPNGRVALLTAYHYQQFIDSLSDAAQTNFYRQADMEKGVVGTYLGFKFMMRSSVQRWRKTGLVWAPVDEQANGYAAGVNDSAASLFYQKDCLERAKGNVDIFDNQNRAEYYGDIYSMELRLGGRQRRPAGVTSVIEDIVAE